MMKLITSNYLIKIINYLFIYYKMLWLILLVIIGLIVMFSEKENREEFYGGRYRGRYHDRYRWEGDNYNYVDYYLDPVVYPPYAPTNCMNSLLGGVRCYDPWSIWGSWFNWY